MSARLLQMLAFALLGSAFGTAALAGGAAEYSITAGGPSKEADFVITSEAAPIDPERCADSLGWMQITRFEGPAAIFDESALDEMAAGRIRVRRGSAVETFNFGRVTDDGTDLAYVNALAAGRIEGVLAVCITPERWTVAELTLEATSEAVNFAGAWRTGEGDASQLLYLTPMGAGLLVKLEQAPLSKASEGLVLSGILSVPLLERGDGFLLKLRLFTEEVTE